MSTTSLENNQTEAEVMLCELLVHHNLPFTAADTFTKAGERMFLDSQIAKELQCGRKKATGLVKELAHMLQIDIVTRIKNQVFAVSTDGSNDISLRVLSSLSTYYSCP